MSSLSTMTSASLDHIEVALHIKKFLALQLKMYMVKYRNVQILCTYIEAILAVMNTTELIVEIRPEKNQASTGSEPQYDTGAALYQ